MRISLIAIGQEYSLNPDQMFAFASHYGGYALKGDNVNDATVPYVMKRHLVHDFKQANKKQDWRKNLVSESLEEFLKLKRYNELQKLYEMG